MPKYTVENSVSEERSTHGSWQAAMNASLRSALKAGGEDAVTITEKDMDGERRGYLGEEAVDVNDTPYAQFGPADWALDFIGRLGGIDGDHHKNWVLDQVARVLLGTPVLLRVARWRDPLKEWGWSREEYRIKTGEPSAEYLAWVDEQMGGTDPETGERECDYDVGTPP